MIEELTEVERIDLRNAGAGPGFDYIPTEEIAKALRIIDAQAKHLAAAQAEVERWKGLAHSETASRVALDGLVRELRAEVERLRAQVADLLAREKWALEAWLALVQRTRSAESRLAAATELLSRLRRENVRWSGTGTTQLARDVDSFLAAQPAVPSCDQCGAACAPIQVGVKCQRCGEEYRSETESRTLQLTVRGLSTTLAEAGVAELARREAAK